MSPYLAAVLAIIALVGAPLGYVFYESALSPDDWIYRGNGTWADGGYHGAPGPIVGTGLPIVLVGGTYWIIRRRRRDGRD